MEPVPVRPLALAVFFRKLAVLLGSGTNLSHSLALLQECTADETLRQATAQLAEAVAAERTLSQGMAELPAVFGPVCLLMVRAGEVGGVLDVTTQRLGEYIETDVELRERLAWYADLAALRAPELRAELADRVQDVLAAERERRDESLFCRALGHMLGAGVPLQLALRCAAEALAPPRAEALRAIDTRDDVAALPVVLQRAGGCSPVTCELCAVGLATGQLDFLMLKAADLLQLESIANLREALPAPA